MRKIYGAKIRLTPTMERENPTRPEVGTTLLLSISILVELTILMEIILALPILIEIIVTVPILIAYLYQYQYLL